MSGEPFFTSEAGVQHFWKDTEDGAVITSVADVAPILERNKAMANHNDGWSPTKEMRRVASIPLALIQKWLVEEGWDAFSPECANKLAQKLNDPQYAYLRTAPGQLGVSNGVMR